MGKNENYLEAALFDWVVTLLVMLSFALPMSALGLSVLPIVYGEQMDVSIAYDEIASSTFDYDSPSAHTANEKTNRTRTDTSIGHFPEFLAAKTTPNTTRLRITRNNLADWRATRDLWDNTGYGDILSDANRAAIARGRTPVVDSSWVRNFPEDAGLLGERIPMHHIQGTPITVPLPATRHLDAHMPGGFRYNLGGPGSALPVYPAPNP